MERYTRCDALIFMVQYLRDNNIISSTVKVEGISEFRADRFLSGKTNTILKEHVIMFIDKLANMDTLAYLDFLIKIEEIVVPNDKNEFWFRYLWIKFDTDYVKYFLKVIHRNVDIKDMSFNYKDNVTDCLFLN